MLINIDNSKYSHIKEFVDTGKDNAFTLANTYMYKCVDGIRIAESNILRNKYRHIVEGFCMDIEFTSDEFDKFRFKPKSLSYALYGTVDLWHTIMWLNNIPTVTQFNIEKLKVIKPVHIKEIRMILEKESENLISSRRT